MTLWVFGYGSIIWKTGFPYDETLVGFIKGYRRVFYQGSTDHRGTEGAPGRTVTLEPAEGEVCWGIAYKITKEEDKQAAIEHLEVREKQYDQKVYVDLFTDLKDSSPAVSGVLVYIGSPDKKRNKNYLGPASLEELAKPSCEGGSVRTFGRVGSSTGKSLMQRVLQGLTETIYFNWRNLFFESVAKMNMS